MPLTDVSLRKAEGRATPYKLTDGGGSYLLVHSRRPLLADGLSLGQNVAALCRQRVGQFLRQIGGARGHIG